MVPGYVQGLSGVPWGECRMENDEPEKCTDQAKNVLRRLASTRESGIVTPRQ
jgi:hypothetical protein